jgi:hypothetical protein
MRSPVFLWLAALGCLSACTGVIEHERPIGADVDGSTSAGRDGSIPTTMMPPILDPVGAAAFYSQNCSACHGGFTVSTIRGATAANMMQALATVPDMAGLKSALTGSWMAQLQLYLAIDSNDTSAACAGPAGQSTESILTSVEFRNSVRDLFTLGAPELAQLILPASVPIKGLGFDNEGETHTFQGKLDKYFQASYTVADLAGKKYQTATSCMTGEQPPACATRLLTRIATLAYRRPPAPDEIVKLTAFFNAGLTFQEGMTNAIRAVLISPRFLIKVRAGVAKMDGYDLAQRLSFFLWQSVPDDALMEKARTGGLDLTAGVNAQVDRMLASPKAMAYESGFVNQWFDLDLVGGSSDPLLLSADTETEMFFKDVRTGTLTLNELFTAKYSYIDTKLAAVYGVAQPAAGFQKVTFPAATPRMGMMTQPAVLIAANTGAMNRTSPVHRGLFMRLKLLCMPAGEPADAVNFPDLDSPTAVMSTNIRQVLAAHEKPGTSCYTCHTKMDPYGWPLEFYNPTGKFRTKYESGSTIDGSSTLTELGNKSIKDAMELSTTLGTQTVVQACVVEKHLRFAVGRELNETALCHARKISASLFGRSARYSDLVKEIVASAAFREE